MTPAQIRNAAIQEAIGALPAYIQNPSTSWFQAIEEYATEAHLELTALLTPEEQPGTDEPGASEPSSSAHCVYTPARHGLGADAQGEAGDFTDDQLKALKTARQMDTEEAGDEPLCERTIQAAIDMLGGRDDMIEAREALISMLPKPDPAKTLVEEWRNAGTVIFAGDTLGTPAVPSVEMFARWLAETGRLK